MLKNIELNRVEFKKKLDNIFRIFFLDRGINTKCVITVEIKAAYIMNMISK
jgi:hypothetical protein